MDEENKKINIFNFVSPISIKVLNLDLCKHIAHVSF